MNLRRIANDISRAALPIAAGVVLLVYGPDIAQGIGRGEVSLWFSLMAISLFAAGVSHILRRLWLPYVELAELFKLLRGHPIGAGLGALGVCVLLAAILLSMSMSAKAALPGDAERLLPTLAAERATHWPDMVMPVALAAQVEQESRWRPDAHLHTAREDGYGLAQFTVTPRFNAIVEIKARHPRELAGWSMVNVYEPLYQLRAMILMGRDLWRGVIGAASDDDRLAMALSAYNGGPGNVTKRRAICRGTAGCDGDRWWGHAELHPPQARTTVQGYGKSFADINSEYPHLIMRVRAPKYAGLL